MFVQPRDYARYLENLAEWKRHFGCKVYGYCLMTNHVHLIVDPGDDGGSLGLLMKRLAGRHTRYVNTLERRTGSLWEGRYKSSPIETDAYLLACTRYVELNPVRARMVSAPADYLWSSYRAKVGLANSACLDLDPCYTGLADTTLGRVRAYEQWVKAAIPDEEWSLIRKAVQTGSVTGNERFAREIEQRTGLRAAARGRGRPKKVAAC